MRTNYRLLSSWLFLTALSVAIGGTACKAPSADLDTIADPTHSLPPDISANDPNNPPAPNAGDGDGTGDPAPDTGDGRAYTTDVLLFNGTGVSTSDWENTERIVSSQGLSYRLANSAELNAMTLDEIKSHGLIIVPGGSGGTITRNLTTETRLRLRQAVRDHGVSYLGFCAGAWVAVGPEAATSDVAGYGLALAPGAVLDLYLPGGRAPTAAMVDVTFSDGSHRELVWWGGPSTPEWKNGVIARYETGEPAISQTWSGKGLVLITGPHPEAPQSWRATAGYDSDGLDYDIAVDLINAGLKREVRPVF